MTAFSADDPQVSVSRRRFVGLSAAAAAVLALGGWEVVTAGCGPSGSSGPTESGGSAADLAKRFRVQRVTDTDPTYSSDQWRLKVTGLVDTELDLTLLEFLALPQTQEVKDFECVERWVVPQVPWEGVAVAEIMDRAGIRSEATHLQFWSDDGVYWDQLTVEDARRPEVLLAHKMGGEELPKDQGWPVRLVVPGDWGYKSVKWVGKIVAAESSNPGYWERRGYPDDATIVR